MNAQEALTELQSLATWLYENSTDIPVMRTVRTAFPAIGQLSPAQQFQAYDRFIHLFFKKGIYKLNNTDITLRYDPLKDQILHCTLNLDNELDQTIQAWINIGDHENSKKRVHLYEIIWGIAIGIITTMIINKTTNPEENSSTAQEVWGNSTLDQMLFFSWIASITVIPGFRFLSHVHLDAAQCLNQIYDRLTNNDTELEFIYTPISSIPFFESASWGPQIYFATKYFNIMNGGQNPSNFLALLCSMSGLATGNLIGRSVDNLISCFKQYYASSATSTPLINHNHRNYHTINTDLENNINTPNNQQQPSFWARLNRYNPWG